MEPQVRVTKVEFLTPARITISDGDNERTILASVDIINRKVYDSQGDSSLSKYVFGHLDDINTLPEDFFAAPPEVYEEAARAQTEQEKMQRETIGDMDG